MTFSHRIWSTSLFSLAMTAAGLSVAPSQGMAGEPVVDLGKQIFEREWTHESPEVLKQGKEESRREFEQRLTKLPGDGLGPMYNATSCEACHAGGGAAGIDRNVTLITVDPRSDVLHPVANTNNGNRRGTTDQAKAIQDALRGLYPGLISPFGAVSMDVVLHEQSARPFYEMIRSEIGQQIPGGAPPEWFVSEKRTIAAIANQPVLAGRMGKVDFYLSQRNSPPLYGLGEIDKIETSRLSLIARSQERRTHGQVSGRVGAGKFGWRAQTPTLDGFVRGACAGELGLQVGRTPQPVDLADDSYVSLGVDLPEPEVTALVSYVRSLPAPVFQTQGTDENTAAREGKRLFAKVGCTMCHVENVYPVRGIYSDLLLHDMGDLLQAPSPAPAGITLAGMPRMRIPVFRPEVLPFGSRSSIGGYYGTPSTQTPYPYPLPRPFEPKFPRGRVPKDVLETRAATEVRWDMLQREWRTPPLWGVADSAPYLHDGRAATLDSAIRWHAGEGSESAGKYRSLRRESRQKLITFLGSLRSPPATPRQETERIVNPMSHVVSHQTEDDAQRMAEAMDVFEQGY